MKLLQAFTYWMAMFTYGMVIMAVLVHHIPYLRASLEVKTDYYYEIMAEEMGLWE
jgi:hypothetical protein